MIRFNGNISSRNYNKPLFWMSLATAVATFPLIFMGGLVTSHGAGMSVPDWPNSWGYNMFAFPPSQWVGGIFYEHTHRLVATGVGFMTIIVVTLAFLTDKRRWVWWTSVALLLAVCAQGALGGFRVVLNMLDLAIIHGIAAQLFFCFIATFCLLLSPIWSQPLPTRNLPPARISNTKLLAALATAAVAFQLVIGAIMRHSGAGLAIPDLPASYGHLLPPTHIDDAFRQNAIATFGPSLGINRVTLFQIWIHFAHRIGALIVTIALSALVIQILWRHRGLRWLTILASTLLGLLAIQLTLGILTVLWRKPADIASMHVAVGALVLMTTWLTFVYTRRISQQAESYAKALEFSMESSQGPLDVRQRMAIR